MQSKDQKDQKNADLSKKGSDLKPFFSFRENANLPNPFQDRAEAGKSYPKFKKPLPSEEGQKIRLGSREEHESQDSSKKGSDSKPVIGFQENANLPNHLGDQIAAVSTQGGTDLSLGAAASADKVEPLSSAAVSTQGGTDPSSGAAASANESQKPESGINEVNLTNLKAAQDGRRGGGKHSTYL